MPFLLRDAPLWSEEERLASEYAMLGFYVSGHPLEKYGSRLAEWNVVRLEEVEGQRNGKEIAVAALIALACAGVMQLAGRPLHAQSSISFGPYLALGLLFASGFQQYWLCC